MKAIRDEFNLLSVLWKLEYFHEYLKDVEKLIEDKAIEFDKRYAKMEQDIKQELDEEDEDWAWPGGWSREAAAIAGLDSYLEDDYNKVKKVFPNLLRRSFFVYVYSVLEDALNTCCRLLNYQRKQLEDVIDAKDKSIKRAKQYLEEANVSFPDKREWNEILLYQRFRNCITHNQGRLKGCNKKDVNAIRNFALRSNSHLSLTYTDNEGNDIAGMSELVEVVFHKGFCEEVIQTIGNFLEQLRINMELRHRNEEF